MRIVPLQPVPAQVVTVTLGGQACTIRVYQREGYGLFLDLAVDQELLLVGVLCQDRNRLVRSAYLGFAGDLAFLDTQGTSDPAYSGIGKRFCLAYLDAGDLAARGLG